MFYVYILKSAKDDSYYTGISTDLKRRLQEHNNGKARYSNLKRPYRLEWYCAFTNKLKAYNFEKYLKSSSGYAFRKKHLAF
jgi:predicted GIY-YIG superfamily endonuclease